MAVRAGPKAEIMALKKYVAELEAHFVARYLSLPATVKPPTRDELLQTGAYVVLVHGALENFIEGLALWTLGRSVQSWTKLRKLSRCTASALLYHPAPKLDGTIHITVFDKLRLTLDEVKQQQSSAIEENNGITLQKIRSLFYPLGVDVPNDPTLAGSIETIVTLRHDWAHQYRFGAKVLKSAKDVQVAVSDCLVFADKLAKNATTAKP